MDNSSCITSNLMITILMSILSLMLVCNIIYFSHINYKKNYMNEHFSLGIIDPYAHQLHKLATEKEARWQLLHRRRFLNHRYYAHQMYKE